MAVASGSAGIVHAISNLLGARYDASHGLANAAALAPTLRFLAPVQPERFARLAEALGVPEADLPALADAVAADDQAHFNSARAPDRDATLAILKGAFSA